MNIQLLKADLKHDSDFVSNMDPYVKFFYNGQIQYSSKVISEGGKNPEWKNECFEMQLNAMKSEMKIEVYD